MNKSMGSDAFSLFLCLVVFVSIVCTPRLHPTFAPRNFQHLDSAPRTSLADSALAGSAPRATRSHPSWRTPRSGPPCERCRPCDAASAADCRRSTSRTGSGTPPQGHACNEPAWHGGLARTPTQARARKGAIRGGNHSLVARTTRPTPGCRARTR